MHMEWENRSKYNNTVLPQIACIDGIRKMDTFVDVPFGDVGSDISEMRGFQKWTREKKL